MATTSTTESAVPTAPPALPTGTPDALPLEQIEEDRVSITGGGGPDWMAAGFGSLWVRTDDAVVVRLAPDGTVEATIDAGIWQQPVCQGLSVTTVAVWACATSGKLMRVDPTTNEVATVVTVPKVNEQGRLTAYDGQIWVLTGDGDELVPVSEKTNRPGRPIPLDAYCTDVADEVVGATLWVVCPYDGAVLSVDLRTKAVTRVDGLTDPTAVSADQNNAWACTDDGIVQLDPLAADAVGIQPMQGGIFCGLRLIDDTLWVRTGNRSSDFLTAIDASTGEIVHTVHAPGNTSGGDLVAFDDALWVSSYEAGLVYRLGTRDL